ncbi:esterase FE4-like [Schistocerca americana]|uniref:esterase FE4-like n=1 Tax=Schistocerca americana TaxID=7009 RepID=UPI001F4F8DC7|nr:esterase FE4-like [Schistocerca americana]
MEEFQDKINEFRMNEMEAMGQEYVTVETQEGTLRGLMTETYTNVAMYKFEGIPYAEPPIGDLRFQPPVPKAAWSGVRDALQVGSKCPQYRDNEVSGDEDCLYLNVYGPGDALQNATLKPVMVRIHGGCFTGGYGHGTIPNYFVDNDVVIVSINYRLGLLGFLSTGDEVVPGNMGLKDQTEALRWVQRNIAAFGGDPDRVTIFGQSAGGASIHYHILSPMSKGLYKNAIAMSGSALNPWAFSRNATDRAIRFAQHLGYTGKTSNDLLKFLKDVDAYTLVLDEKTALSEEPGGYGKAFGLLISRKLSVVGFDRLFVYTPDAVSLDKGTQECVEHHQVNSLFFTAGGQLSTEAAIKNLNDNFDEIVGNDLRLPTKEEQQEGAESIKKWYYNGSDITLKDNYTTALAQEYVTVEIQEGTLRGQMSKTWTDIPMFMFQGIPYAEPPVGDLRFQPPVSKAAWSGVRDALAVGSMCPQLDNNAASGDEDCLYLNVFGPETALQKEELKPVMVWIHGGCFTSGYGQGATPNYYVDQDVILVSINYRLGLLGNKYFY